MKTVKSLIRFYISLHGMGGDEEAWIALGRTSQILDNLIAQGKAKPMLVVMPLLDTFFPSAFPAGKNTTIDVLYFSYIIQASL
jgi:hypothetical protein